MTEPVTYRCSRPENLAGLWLHRLGYTDAALTAPGHDYGIDVVSKGAVAQVKRWRTKNVGIREVQRLASSAEPGQTCLFFASRGYTKAAQAWAGHSEQRVSLFVMRDNGTLIAINRWAYQALCRAPKKCWRPGEVPSTPPMTRWNIFFLAVAPLLLLAMSWTLTAAWLSNGDYSRGAFMAIFFAVLPVALILGIVKVSFSGLRRGLRALYEALTTRSVAPVKRALEIYAPSFAGGAAPDQFVGIHLDNMTRLFNWCEDTAMKMRIARRRRSIFSLRRRTPRAAASSEVFWNC
ncbi:restriction endonuclease [Actinoplanes sp. CA-051413]|uniref:restriction endonuclease n=1 Tax=Actinoplanes sp. CA-051413 TaxID=3239899 RepID=UPI003D9A09C7